MARNVIRDNLIKLLKGSGFHDTYENHYRVATNDVLITRDGKRVIFFKVSNGRFVCDMDIARIFNHNEIKVYSYPLDIDIPWNEYDLAFSRFGGVCTLNDKYIKFEMTSPMDRFADDMDKFIPAIQDESVMKLIIMGKDIPKGTEFSEDWEQVPFSHDEMISILKIL